MSYRIQIEPYTNDSSYIRSFIPIIDKVKNTGVGLKTMHNMWEETYGATLILGRRTGVVIGIEFPTESDATMFLLRWS